MLVVCHDGGRLAEYFNPLYGDEDKITRMIDRIAQLDCYHERIDSVFTAILPKNIPALVEQYPGQTRLWDAINAVVVASGGNPGNTSVARQRAVVEVEDAVRYINAHRP